MIIASPMSPKKQLQILRSQWTFHITHVVLPTSGLFPSAFKQGGKCTLKSRESTKVYYPIQVTKVLAIQATGTALSIGQTNYGYGLAASNADSAGFTLMNCSEEAPRYYKEASWIVIGI